MNPDWFWGRVERGLACWPWTGGVNRFGYGQAKKGGKSFLAHRAAYLLANNYMFLPDNILHKCDNPLCCNPDHLIAGTHAENMADMKAKGRRKGIAAGVFNGRAKLNPETCEQIRKERASGAMLKDLAPKYNVALSTISRVCRGENWK
jgi:hypothetical protein